MLYKKKMVVGMLCAILLTAIMFFIINFFASERANVQERLNEIILDMISVVDDYLDMKIEAGEAYEKLRDLTYNLWTVSEERGGGINLLLQGHIALLNAPFQTISVFNRVRDRIDDDEVFMRRNNLAQTLNQPLREN